MHPPPAARLRHRFAALVAVVVLAGACATDGDGASPATPAGPVVAKKAVVVETYPHDTLAYTQGLDVAGDGRLWESTGLVGRSTLREVDLATGNVLRSTKLPADQFGEGLAEVGDELIVLTWKDGVAHRYRADDFAEVGEFTYDGEGWGLCLDDDRLVMSDGSANLTFRDPETFEVLERVQVTLNGKPLSELNELECVDGRVFANVYQTDRIVEIDPDSGAVVADIDASGLLPEDQRAGVDVLNGIAWDEQAGVFYLTGKLWPTLFAVTFEPA